MYMACYIRLERCFLCIIPKAPSMLDYAEDPLHTTEAAS